MTSSRLLLTRAQRSPPQLRFDEAAQAALVGYADGDARRLLNLTGQLPPPGGAGGGHRRPVC